MLILIIIPNIVNSPTHIISWKYASDKKHIDINSLVVTYLYFFLYISANIKYITNPNSEISNSEADLTHRMLCDLYISNIVAMASRHRRKLCLMSLLLLLQRGN